MSIIGLIPFSSPNNWTYPLSFTLSPFLRLVKIASHAMKSADEIVRYIEDFYSRGIERPEMYFGSPSQMEAVLSEFERFYEFIVDDEWEFPGCCDFGYSGFLEERGYGVGRFTGETRRDSNEFLKMAAFWREYLASDWRKGPRGERSGNKYRKKGHRFDSTGKTPEEFAREVNEWMEAEEARQTKEGAVVDQRDQTTGVKNGLPRNH